MLYARTLSELPIFIKSIYFIFDTKNNIKDHFHLILGWVKFSNKENRKFNSLVLT